MNLENKFAKKKAEMDLGDKFARKKARNLGK
jgi:hypothetical protein